MSWSARLLVVGLLLILSGCSGPAVRFIPEDNVHVVKPGETLYSIATAYDMDWRELASRNDLRPPYTLRVGQRLVLAKNRVMQGGAAADPRPQAPSKIRKASPPLPPIGKIRWVWPTEGRVVTTFVQGHPTRKGIDIAGELGQPVRAAASGEVVYSGSGLAGYGRLIILKHDERFLSAYAYNQTLLVSEGETVQSGQIIARMGQAEAGKPMLHFEIRLDGNPIDPLRQLPQASR
ncbi:MAG: peptidoglycan DD-metalloendopeptidase family protein [Gammaproteobacteria bacterium]|nr:peptidoglycan DD-metalloendopeptidase family protein [Gammaproteobacteria bacterium]